MPKAVVLIAAIRYTDADGVARDADHGAEVDLTDSEFKRLKALDGVAAPRSKDAKVAQAEAEAEAAGQPLPVEPEPEAEPES